MVEVNYLSKSYKLYHSHRDRVKEWLHPLRRKYHRIHHALRDISFQLNRSDVLGVIGQNGSGKSTLLKILSSVISPTSGSFSLNGRMSALLELGGGFNNDISGVENLLFLGAIQGYSKKEMRERMNEILDFAEIGDYAFQPVKNYSSGMYVRLAFSINININPDILIVDEALAVGDIRFQQKCFSKIKEFKESGKTIIICTHNLSAVSEFCTEAIWLHHGKIMAKGDPLKVSEKYKTFMTEVQVEPQQIQPREKSGDEPENLPVIIRHPIFQNLKWINLQNLHSSGSLKAKITHAAIVNKMGNKQATVLKGGEDIMVAMILETNEDIHLPGISLDLHGHLGTEIIRLNNRHYKQPVKFNKEEPSLQVFEFKFPMLANGNYTISLGISEIAEERLQILHQVQHAFVITVSNTDTRFRAGGQIVLEDARIISLT